MAEYINLNGYHYTKPTDPLRTDSARLYIDIDKPGESSTVNESTEKWTPPNTAELESLQNSNNNILHLKSIHSFKVKTLRDPWAIDRIKKGYITDENGTVVDSTYTPGLVGTLNSNSDGYMTYTLGIRA